MYELITMQEAERHGFPIKREMGFLFDLGCTTAILAYNGSAWQFNTGTDHEGESWQFVDPDMYSALAKAEHVATMMASYTKFLNSDGVVAKDIAFINLLDIAFEGCNVV